MHNNYLKMSCLYYKQKRQISYDNGLTWQDTGEYRKGDLYERDSYVCDPTVQYRWVDAEIGCSGNNKVMRQWKQKSTDGGRTWTPVEDRYVVLEYDSPDCGYVAEAKARAFYEDDMQTDIEDDGTYILAERDLNPQGYNRTQMTDLIVLDTVYTIGDYAFRDCLNLSSVTLSETVSVIKEYAFYNCPSLTSITIPSGVSQIRQNAFAYDSALEEVHMLSSIPPTIADNSFSGMAENGHIYVPCGSLEAYLNSTNWSNYEDKLVEESDCHVYVFTWGDSSTYKTDNYASTSTGVTLSVITTLDGDYQGYTISSYPSWVTGHSIDTGNSTISFTWADNQTSTAKTGTIVLRQNGSGKSVFLNLTQSAGELVSYIFTWGDSSTAKSEIYEATSTGVSLNVISQKNSSFQDYVVTSRPDWVTGYTKYNYGTGSTIIFNWDENESYITKSGQIVLTQNESGNIIYINVVQNAAIPTTYVFTWGDSTTAKSETYSASTTGASLSIVSTKNGTYQGYSVTSYPNWVTGITTGSSSISLAWNANLTQTANTGTVVLTQNESGNQIQLALTQSAVLAHLKATLNYSGGGSYDVECTSSSQLSQTETQPSGYDYSAMTSAVIGDCITSIGMYAFQDATSLSSVTIPTNVTEISISAFHGDTALSSITIPTSLTRLGISAFEGCTSLQSITLPSGVTSIESSTFKGCTSLSSVTLPDNATSIGNSAFEGCTSLPSITMPNTVSGLGSFAFRGCTSLSSVTISNSVSGLGSFAFNGCTSLSSVTIPNSVSGIGYGSFLSCTSLSSVTIPQNVTSIGNSAFSSCSGLTGITVLATTPPTLEYSESEGVKHYWQFFNTNNCPIYVPCGTLSAYQSADGWSTYSSRIQELPECAHGYVFTWSGGLTSKTETYESDSTGASLTIVTTKDGVYQDYTVTSYPNWVTGVTKNSGSSTISFAWDENQTLTANTGTVVLTQNESGKQIQLGLTQSSAIGDFKVYLVGTDSSVYRGDCDSTSAVTSADTKAIMLGRIRTAEVGGCVTGISSYAFYCEKLMKDVTIHNGTTVIGTGAFDECTGLSGVTLPNTLTTIGNAAFRVTYPLSSITIPSSVTSIGQGAFLGSGIRSIDIPSGVTAINDETFKACGHLSSVTIPNSVTNIGGWSFYGCSALASVNIPNSVTSIGTGAFRNCYSLTSVTIPTGVTYLGGDLFSGCTSLSSVTIPSSVTSIGLSAFRECSLTSVTIPSSVTYIGAKAFYGCHNLSYVVMESATPPDMPDLGSPQSFVGSSCPIYVPCASVDTYKNNSEWSIYSSRIQANPDCANYTFTWSDSSSSDTVTYAASSTGATIQVISTSGNSYAGFYLVSKPNWITGFTINSGSSTIVMTWNANQTQTANTGTVILQQNWTGNQIELIVTQNAAANNKVVLHYSNGDTYTGTCNSNSTLTSDETDPEGYDFLLVDYAVIGECVETIGVRAFSYFISLSSVTIPSSVESIYAGAFDYCSGLTSVTIPSMVTEIGGGGTMDQNLAGAFYGCNNLASITVEATTPPILHYAADQFGDTNDCPIYVPSESLNAYLNDNAWSQYASRIQGF